MSQGVSLTDEQVTVIREIWVPTNSFTAAAVAAGCSVTTARKYVNSCRDDLLRLRAQKKGDNLLADAFKAAASFLLGEALSPEKIAHASTKDLMTSVGIAVDKAQLLSGQATSRSETITDPAARLTPEEMELAARIREKHAAVEVT